MEVGKRLLVVEDNELIRHLCVRNLSRKGYSVHEAVNGLQALEMLKTDRFDLVVTDIKMPMLDGIGLYETALNYHPYLKNRFFFITGNPDMILPVMENRYLLKPFMMSDFVNIIEALVEMQPSVAPLHLLRD